MPRLFLMALVFAATTAAAAPKAELWQRWTTHDEKSTATIDHSAWSQLLARHVENDPDLDLNRVRYDAFSQADRAALQAYIQRLESVDIDGYRQDEQLAFWLNLYNAATVARVLQDYPIASIRDIGRGLFTRGPWQEELVRVNGVALSLNDIEHRILRPIWDASLMHYGVNCASVGCPNLQAEAYTGDRVHEQLRANAKAHVNSPRGVRLDGGKIRVSKIYHWYAEDFGDSTAGVISHLRRYAAPALSARLDAADGIDDYIYDWTLNDATLDD